MIRTFVPAIALLLPALRPQESSSPPTPPTQAPAKAVSPADAKAEAARAQRLGSQRAALETELAAIEKFGHLDEFLARVKDITAARIAAPDTSFGYSVAGGVLPWRTLENYESWHLPAEGRQLPSCVDLELKDHPFAAIVDAARQFRAANIDLLIVAFPSRVELYPELLLDVKDFTGFAGMGQGSVRFLLELNRAGVETLSLGPTMAAHRHNPDDPDDPLFLASDPHWRPRGAELAAKAVAAQVRKYPWFVTGTMAEGRSFRVLEEYYVFEPSTDEMADKSARPERVSANTVTVKGFNRGEFEARFARIIVLGDSFVREHGIHGADFASQLLRFTGHQLDIVNAASGADLICRQKLATRPAEEWRGKKVVVWLLAHQIFKPGERWAPLPLGLR